MKAAWRTRRVAKVLGPHVHVVTMAFSSTTLVFGGTEQDVTALRTEFPDAVVEEAQSENGAIAVRFTP